MSETKELIKRINDIGISFLLGIWFGHEPESFIGMCFVIAAAALVWWLFIWKRKPSGKNPPPENPG